MNQPHSLPMVLAALTAVLLSNALSQPATPPPPPVVVEDFKVESAAAPGGGSWLRLLAPFRSSPKWADGIAFSYSVLVERDGTYRVLTGTARYANVKGGRQLAVLYMSPSTAERFGAPVAAEIAVGYNDEVVQSFKWEMPGRKAPDSWQNQFARFPNLILPIHFTPFVATEYGKFPDVLPGQ